MEELSEEKKFALPGVRFLFAGLGFFGFGITYAIRVNINIAIIAMINSTAVYHRFGNVQSGNGSTECSSSYSNGTSYESFKDGEFVWSPAVQGNVIGAFYYGYSISQIPGGRLAEVASGKWTFGLGILIPCLLTLVTPIAARWHVGLLIAIRVVEGLAQGVTFPAMHALLGKWAPDGEMSLMSALVTVGVNVGTVATMPLVGFLCDSDFLGGWPAAFYVVGMFGCLWFLCWCFLMSETPSEHPFISAKELKYIQSNQKIHHHDKLPPIPWLKIMKSWPVWALVVIQVGQDWRIYTLINDLPTYFATILHFPIEKNGFLTALPHLLQGTVGLSVAYVGDMIIRRGRLSKNFVRKFCNTIAGLSISLGLVGICLAGCDSTITIVCYVTLMGFAGFCYGGYVVNALDISPEYAGTLYGLTSTISNLGGFATPLIVGALTENYQTLKQWQYVFGLAVAFMMVSTVVFIFTSTEKQDWIAQDSPYDVLKTVEETSVNSSDPQDKNTTVHLSNDNCKIIEN